MYQSARRSGRSSVRRKGRSGRSSIRRKGRSGRSSVRRKGGLADPPFVEKVGLADPPFVEKVGLADPPFVEKIGLAVPPIQAGHLERPVNFLRFRRTEGTVDFAWWSVYCEIKSLLGRIGWCHGLKEIMKINAKTFFVKTIRI
ncbi:hypothetical protein TNCV_4809031 [Trichonephila clavipes]|nr:hypothetical protein TNCV_4809031 [Trichonephila clavipes]